MIKTAQSKPSDLVNGPETNMTADEHRLLNQYKEVIREQDQQLTLIRREFCALKEEHSRVLLQMQEQSAHIQQLKDQNALLKAQKSATSSTLTINMGSDESTQHNTLAIEKNCEQLKSQIQSLLQEIEKRDKEITFLVRFLSNSIQKIFESNDLFDRKTNWRPKLSNRVTNNSETRIKTTANHLFIEIKNWKNWLLNWVTIWRSAKKVDPMIKTSIFKNKD